MNDMQKRILGLLLEVDALCQKYDIEYYLEGGAVLGALRHGGFLPWDDDTDITMTRDNWEKFKIAFFKENPENRALEAPELNEEYPTNTVRYIDTSTTNIWRSMMFDVAANGLAVDIFILEDAPDDDEKLEQMKRDFIDHCEIINPYYRLSSLGDGKRYAELLQRTRTQGKKKVVDELERKILKYHGQGNRYLMRWGMRFQVYNKDVFGKPVRVPFEDVMLPIPEKPIDYLVYQYGMDWFMIPSNNEVEVHDTVRDLDLGYKTYMDDYMPLINKKEALDINFKYKIAEMQILDYNKEYHHHIYGTAGGVAAKILSKKLKNIDLDLTFKEVTPHTETLFKELFSDYLAKQLHEWYLFYNVYVPIEDDILACIISFLLRTGRVREAEKLILIRRNQKQSISDKLENSIKSYDILVESSCLFWSGKQGEAAQLIKSTKDIVYAPVELAFMLYNEAADKGNLEEIKKQAEHYIRLYPSEDLFKLTLIRVLIGLMDTDSAVSEAKELLKRSSNGMVLMWLKNNKEYQDIVGRCL